MQPPVPPLMPQITMSPVLFTDVQSNISTKIFLALQIVPNRIISKKKHQKTTKSPTSFLLMYMTLCIFLTISKFKRWLSNGRVQSINLRLTSFSLVSAICFELSHNKLTYTSTNGVLLHKHVYVSYFSRGI